MRVKKTNKILYLITKSNFGGAQKYVYELSLKAREAGYLVAVAGGGTGERGAPTGDLGKKLANQKVSFIRVKNFMRNMSFLNDMRALFECIKIINEEKPEILHTSSSKAGGLGNLAGRLMRVKKIIFVSHGLTFDETWRPSWQRSLIYLGTWLTILLSHHTIVISTENYQRAKSMWLVGNKVVLINNGVAPIDFLNQTKARKALGLEIPKSAVWVGGVGELHPNKNWTALIKAIKNLPDKVHLVIIGEGEERPSLQKLITALALEKRVHLLGYLEADQYFKAFDIFVLPSKKEGLPYVILEAGLAELPVIASHLPGNEDIINTGETGYLVEPSPNNLTATLEILIRDEGIRRRLGTNLKTNIENRFSIDKMAKDTFRLYEFNTSAV
jgi:glycosyltransferase involved in cell wall biosynthesis